MVLPHFAQSHLLTITTRNPNHTPNPNPNPNPTPNPNPLGEMGLGEMGGHHSYLFIVLLSE